jgi:hypothetical protein
MQECVSASSSLALAGGGLNAVWVLALTAAVALAAAGMLKMRITLSGLRKVFVAASIVCFAALTDVALVRFDLYHWAFQDDSLMEWLAAAFLLVAWVIGAVAVARGAARREPAPLAMFLASGYFVAFWRELEFGGSFFGEKVWHKRNLLMPRAYFDPSHFRQYVHELEVPRSPETLYAIHLVTSIVLAVLVVVAVTYLLRHRCLFARQLRALPAAAHGRYFLLGLGLYLGAHALGKVINYAKKAAPELRSFAHRLLEEPLEFWAATALLFSMLALWTDARSERDGTTQ